MKTQYLLFRKAIAALTLSLAVVISSCSKKGDATPTQQTPSNQNWTGSATFKVNGTPVSANVKCDTSILSLNGLQGTYQNLNVVFNYQAKKYALIWTVFSPTATKTYTFRDPDAHNTIVGAMSDDSFTTYLMSTDSTRLQSTLRITSLSGNKLNADFQGTFLGQGGALALVLTDGKLETTYIKP